MWNKLIKVTKMQFDNVSQRVVKTYIQKKTADNLYNHNIKNNNREFPTKTFL